MFRRFLRSFSDKPVPSKRLAKLKAMSRTRFIVNELPDYSGIKAIPVPEDNIRRQIQEYVGEIRQKFEPSELNAKDGLYLGSAGVAYMYYHLSKNPALRGNRAGFLDDALEYLQPALTVARNEVNKEDVPALLLGSCGVYAVASAIYHAKGKNKECVEYRNLYNEAARTCKVADFLPAGSDELFVGRAGYICGALWIARETGIPFKTEDVFDLCRIIIASGRQYSENTKHTSPLMYSYYDVEYIGAGHGVCSILQMLMTVPGYLDANPTDAKDIKAAVDFILSLQDSDGNFPPSTEEARNQINDLVHWCHGAGGAVYLMAKAYLTWHESKYLMACQSAAELIWERGLLKKGPGICHGIAGNGYVFLLLYRLTDDYKYLHRAIQFSQFLDNPEFKLKARVPDNPYSLYEGTAGTVCFLGDLLSPKNANFPFTDAF